MQRDELFKGFQNLPYRKHLMGRTSSWATPKKTPDSPSAMQSWHKGTYKSFKGCKGQGHILGNISSLHMCRDRKGEGSLATQIFSPYSSLQAQCKQITKGFLWTLSAIREMSNTSTGFTCWQIVPLFNERSLFITVCQIDHTQQRWAKKFKQVFPDPVFCITGKQRQTTILTILGGKKGMISNIVTMSASVS